MGSNKTAQVKAPKAKHTELPIGWQLMELKDVSENITKGSTPTTYGHSWQIQGIPFLRSECVSENGLNMKASMFISEEANSTLHRSIIKPGDILMTITGNIGRVCEVPDNLKVANINQHIARIRVNSDSVDKKFIFQYLNQDKTSGEYLKITTGQAYPQISLKQVRETLIPLPPLPEQHAIANILSIWDSAIQTTQKLISQKEQEKKWLMQNLLTGKKRLTGFEKTKWKKVSAGDGFKSYTKKGFENEELLSATQDRGIIPRSMLEGRVTMPDGSTSGYKLVAPGDFIISLRSFQGGLEYSYYRGIVSPAYIVLKPKLKINDEFYKQYFKSYEFIGRLATAVIGIRDGKQISYDDFCIVKIPNPSIEEQTAIAQVLQTADKEIKLLKTKLDQQKLQKKGLMQVLLTGKVRVKN